ncbi:unnamed protein product [Moneuplotes crassus]|uniref:Uncharacterized protein n=1 Tax=Euplotes crassus TaxID=5936 RepID=A0AAD1UPB4_EUPCR|nr:unnamed protein product [Moneuplotes crassus]
MSYRVTPKRHRSSARNIPSPKKTSELSNISLFSKVSDTRNGLKTTRNHNYSSPINMKHESCMLPQKKPDYNIDERLKGIKDKLENANKRHLQSLVLKQVKSICKVPSRM